MGLFKKRRGQARPIGGGWFGSSKVWDLNKGRRNPDLSSTTFEFADVDSEPDDIEHSIVKSLTQHKVTLEYRFKASVHKETVELEDHQINLVMTNSPFRRNLTRLKLVYVNDDLPFKISDPRNVDTKRSYRSFYFDLSENELGDMSSHLDDSEKKSFTIILHDERKNATFTLNFAKEEIKHWLDRELNQEIERRKSQANLKPAGYA